MSAEFTVVGDVSAAPGQRAEVVLRLTNTGTSIRTFLVSIIGLDTGWSPAPVRTPPLAEGQAAEVTLSLRPPAGTPAGSYRFIAVAQSIEDSPGVAPVTVETEAALEVGDAAALSLEVLPAEPAAMRTRRLRILLTNRGTKPLSLQLSVTPAAGLDVWLRDREVDLGAGESAEVRARATTTRRRWMGQPRRMPFVVTAQGHTVPVRLNAVFVGRPVFNRTVTRLLAAVAIVTVWASVALVGLDAISKNAHKKETASLTQLDVKKNGGNNGSNGSGGAGGGGGSGGSGGAGGAGAGAGGGAAGAAGAAGAGSQSTASRLNGTVTGAAPGGVTVSIRPTSLVDESSQGVTFVNTSETVALGDQIGKLSASSVDLGRPRTDSVVRRTTSANDGSFAFAGIKAPGYYLVQLAKRGYQTAKFIINAQVGVKLPTLSVPLVAGKGRLSGAVSDAHGHLLGGAHVVLTNGAVTLATNTPGTGKVGNWSIGGLSTPGTYLVSASRDGFDLESAIVTLDASGSATQNITLKAGVESLTGTISDSNGNGVAGATITATNGTLSRSVTSVSGTTGSGSPVGSYVLPALPTGAYTVTVAAPGFSPQTLQVSLNGKVSSIVRDAQLTSATAIFGGVINDAGPAPGTLPGVPLTGSAGLVLQGDNGTYKTMSVSVTGVFTFTGVAPGDYVLTATSFLHTTNYAKVTLHAGQDLEGFSIALVQDPTGGIPPIAHITGSIVDAHTGAALTCPQALPSCSATIKLFDAAVPPPPALPTAIATTTANPGVPYTIPGSSATGLLPGLYEIQVSAPGYESGSIRVQVNGDPLVTAQPIALTPEGTILGHVSSPGDVVSGCVAATPVTALTVNSAPAPPGADPTHPQGVCPVAPTGSGATTACIGDNPTDCVGDIGPLGDYEIDFVPARTYWMYVIPDNAQNFVPVAPAKVTLQQGQTQRYDVSINRLALVDVIVQEPNSAGDAVNVGSGIPVVLTLVPASPPPPGTPPTQYTANTNTSGVAEFTAIQQGSYTLSATDTLNGDSRTLTGVVVGLNQSLTLPLVLVSNGAAMVGRVYGLVDGAKTAVTDATVTVTGVVSYSGSVPHRAPVTVHTDSNGCFAINNGAPGTLVAAPTECGGGSFSGSSVADGGFVAPTVSFTVDPTNNPAQDRFEKTSQTNFQFPSTGDAAAIVLPVPPTSVTVKVAVDPDPSVNGKTAADAVVQVTQLPPGAGAVVVTVNADGTLKWVDPTLSDSQQHHNGAVPGTYHLRASLDGFDDVTDYTIVVPADTASADDAAGVGMPVSDFSANPLTLQEHGALALVAQDEATAVAIDGAVFTVSGAGIATTTLATAPGSNTVTVPDLSVAGGPYTVTARAPGYHFDPQQFNVTPGTTGTVPVMGQQLATLTGTVFGRTDGTHESPLGGVTVRATDGPTTFSAVSAADGTYRITGTTDREGIALGSMWGITASVFGYGNATVSGVSVGGTGGDVTVPDLVLDANPVNATIVVQADGTNAAIDGATVTLHNSSALPGGSVSCTTDGSATPAGSCVLDALPPTTYAIVVTKPGFAPLSTAVTFQVGIADQEAVFVLAPRTNTISGSVIGQALDGSTKTLWNSTDGLTVTLTSTDPSSTINLTQTPGSASATGVAGDFSFTGIPDSAPGTSYVVTVSSNASTGFQGATRPVTVSGGQVASVEIALQPLAPQQVTVTVTSTTGESMAGAAVTLLDSTGSTVVQTGSPAEPVTAGGTPTTTFNQVPQGSYKVKVDGVNGHLGTTSAAFTVGTGAVTEAVSVSEQLLHLTATSVRAAGTVPPTATFTITNNATSDVISPSPSVTADNETVDVYVPPAAYTVAAALGAADAPNYSTPSSQNVTQAPNGGGTNWIQSLTFSFTQTIATSLTVTVTGAGAGQTVAVTLKGGNLPAAGTTLNSCTGSCTFNNLVPDTYTVSATTTNGSAKTGTVTGVTVVQGSNSVTVALA